jgi:hypothetical protein
MFMTERTQIAALDNGPYLVKGPLMLLDADGNELQSVRPWPYAAAAESAFREVRGLKP